MRIIAGELRGRTLRAPAGQGTRPTTDRVREGLFSALFSARSGFEGAVALDAFAGSGALGLEAISRGAAHATFCERDRRAADVLQANLAIAPAGTARLARVDVERGLPPAPPAPFDLLLLDPPYALAPDAVAALAARWQEAALVAPGALASYEHDASADDAAEAAFAALQWEHAARKRYGKTTIDLFKRAR